MLDHTCLQLYYWNLWLSRILLSKLRTSEHHRSRGRRDCAFQIRMPNLYRSRSIFGPYLLREGSFPSRKLDKSTGSSSSLLECDNRPRSQVLMCVALFCMSGLPVEAVRRDGHYILEHSLALLLLLKSGSLSFEVVKTHTTVYFGRALKYDLGEN